MNRRCIITTVTLALVCVYHLTFAQRHNDSTIQSRKERLSSAKFTTRFHSDGLFMYVGRIANRNSALDFNFTYERKNLGYTVFKVFDVKDLRSNNNFTLITLFRKIRLAERLTITPNLAIILEQTHGIASKGSDGGLILITAYRLNKKFVLDHTAILTNMVIERKSSDWINRFRLLYAHKHVDITALAWNNNRVFDEAGYVTIGLSSMYSRVKLSENLLLGGGLTGMMMVNSSDEEMLPKKNAITATVMLTLQ